MAGLVRDDEYFRRRRVLGLRGLGLALAWLLSDVRAWNASRFQELAFREGGAHAVRRLEGWLKLLEQLKAQPVPAQLDAVNDFWNTEILASLDSRIWKKDDYWATPLQTLIKGAGDCEDFVIGKYFSLRRLGVPMEKMRLIYVRARRSVSKPGSDIAHMVLGIYETPYSDPLILDNLIDTIRNASSRRDLTPVFSFDAESIYVGGKASSKSTHINRWQDLLVRMRNEGFDV